MDALVTRFAVPDGATPEGVSTGPIWASNLEPGRARRRLARVARHCIWLYATLCLAGCKSNRAKTEARGTASASSSAAKIVGNVRMKIRSQSAGRPAPATPCAKSDTVSHRHRGELSGGFMPKRTHVTQGEPIRVQFSAKNSSKTKMELELDPISVGTGRRRWDAAYNLVVCDEHGKALCDTSAAPLDGDGSSVTRRLTLAPDANFEEELILNSGCDALRNVGRYRITMVRALGSEVTTPPSGCPADRAHGPARSDYTQEVVRRAHLGQCRRFADRYHWLASDFQLEVAPYARDALQKQVRGMPEEYARAPDETKHVRWYARWFCEAVRCDCPEPPNIIGFMNRAGEYRKQTQSWLSAALEPPPRLPTALCR